MEKIKEAEIFLIERENKLNNIQSICTTSGKVPGPFMRGNHLSMIINSKIYQEN